MTINYQALQNWVSGVSQAQIDSLNTQVQAWGSSWASLVNRINTQGYIPTSTDIAALYGTGSTSLTALLNSLQPLLETSHKPCRTLLWITLQSAAHHTLRISPRTLPPVRQQL